MDALLIGPALALSFAATLLLGKTLLSLLLTVMGRNGPASKARGYITRMARTRTPPM